MLQVPGDALGWLEDEKVNTELGVTAKVCALQRPQRVSDGVRGCEAPLHVQSKEGTN